MSRTAGIPVPVKKVAPIAGTKGAVAVELKCGHVIVRSQSAVTIRTKGFVCPTCEAAKAKRAISEAEPTMSDKAEAKLRIVNALASRLNKAEGRLAQALADIEALSARMLRMEEDLGVGQEEAPQPNGAAEAEQIEGAA